MTRSLNDTDGLGFFRKALLASYDRPGVRDQTWGNTRACTRASSRVDDLGLKLAETTASLIKLYGMNVLDVFEVGKLVQHKV